MEGGHSQHCVCLKGLVSILRDYFEERISVWGVTEVGDGGQFLCKQQKASTTLYLV